MIILLIGVVVFVIALKILHRGEEYLLLDEVIPQGRIMSEEEGIVEYKDVQYILGTHDLKRQRYLINHLHLLDLEGSLVVDMRFEKQIIVRNLKKGTEVRQPTSGPKIY